MDFRPANATESLRKFAFEIEKIGEELDAKRADVLLKQAKLYDLEQCARDMIFKEEVQMPVTKIREWIKWTTFPAERDYEIAKEELRGLIERKEILVESINALKSAVHIWRIEANNLNLDT